MSKTPKITNSLYLVLMQCPPPPSCCESGQYAYDECGCCLKCAKAELQKCGGASDISGKCAEDLQCLKTCREYLSLSPPISQSYHADFVRILQDSGDQWAALYLPLHLPK